MIRVLIHVKITVQQLKTTHPTLIASKSKHATPEDQQWCLYSATARILKFSVDHRRCLGGGGWA